MIEDERGSTSKYIILVVTFAIFLVLAIFLVFFIIESNKNKEQPASSSSIIPSSSEVISSSSSEEVDTYIDDTIINIKNYISKVSKDVLLSELTVDHLYSVNSYVEGESTHLVYGFTFKEDTTGYIRFEIDLEEELTISQIIEKIHSDLISPDMYVGHQLYKTKSVDITSKETFKELYIGTYHPITYVDDSEQYHMSGIGKDGSSFACIDDISFNESTFEIDNTDAHFNSDTSSTNRYYQLLEKLY